MNALTDGLICPEVFLAILVILAAGLIVSLEAPTQTPAVGQFIYMTISQTE